MMLLIVQVIGRVYLKIIGWMDKASAQYLLSQVRLRGIKCRLEGRGILYEPENVELGSYVFIGRNFFLRAAGGISIGNYTHISRNVVIHTSNHNTHGALLPYDRNDILSPVVIGQYVWIGMNVCILPGVTIGDGAVVGMGTVVSKNIAPGEIVVGSAQRVVGLRDQEKTRKMVLENKFLM